MGLLARRSPSTFRIAALGLTKEALMGELNPLTTLPANWLCLFLGRLGAK